MYFPLDFEKTRSVAKSFLTEWRAAGRPPPPRSHDIAFKLVLDAYMARGIGPKSPAWSMRNYTADVMLLLMWGQWHAGGEIIFDFSPALTEAFQHSDIDDLSLADIQFPYESFYLHFGPQPQLSLFQGTCVPTGVFIAYSPSVALRFAIVGESEANWPNPLKPAVQAYDLRIAKAHFEKDMGTALDCALADDLADLASVAHGANTSQFKQSAAIEAFQAAHLEHQDSLRGIVRLALNGLVYLTAYPDDVSAIQYPSKAPARLVKQALEGTPTERRRAESKLRVLGWGKMRTVGQHFAQADPHESGMRTHWRRGHWRRQAHGPQMSQRKLIWLKPMRIGKTGESVPAKIFKLE